MILKGSQPQLAKKAAALLYDTTHALLQNKRKVVIAVPGGRSVAAIYQNFGKYDLPWGQVHLFLLDERLVAADHPDSNYRLVCEQMQSAMGPVVIHQFKYDAADPQLGVIDYQNQLQHCGGRFDIVLASSGEDGHIGSLFPNHPSLAMNHSGFFLLEDAPKPPPGRMTASFQLIQQAETGILLFFGSSKRQALRSFTDTRLTCRECPARIMTQLPRYYLLTDQEVDSL